MASYQCPICGGKAKNPEYFDDLKHIKTKTHQKALSKLDSKDEISQREFESSTEITTRITQLENQNKDILNRLDKLEFLLSEKQQEVKQQEPKSEAEQIKSFLLTNIPKGRTAKIDQIASLLSRADWKVVENVIIHLIDAGIFTPTEGKSKKKIQGKYAFIIRT
ncbi:MAG: hypothetical protein ACXAD7_11665 [Candidatus Kariarchaeaceae archaeon]